MEKEYKIVKTADNKYDVISMETNERVLSDSYDLILPIIGNRYAIVGNKARRRFKEYNREVTEYSYHYYAFDLYNEKEIVPLKNDHYLLLYINLENQTFYYSLESDEKKEIKEKSLSGRRKRYSGPVIYQSRQFNYRLPEDPQNRESPDYVNPEKDIDTTGVFPHTDRKWDFIYSFLSEDKSCDQVHRFCFSFGDIIVPNAHITIINNQFCIISQTILKELSSINDGYAPYGDRVYGEDDERVEVFQKNVAIFNEYWNCILFTQDGFNYEIASDNRLMVYRDFPGDLTRFIIDSSGKQYSFPTGVILHDEEYALQSDHLFRMVSKARFGFTNLDAETVIPCYFPRSRYKFFYYRDPASIHASTFYDALEGDASNYWNID